MKVGLIGAGAVGARLADLAVAAGHEVRAGVRDPARGAAAAQRGWQLAGIDEALDDAELVLLALPFQAAVASLGALAPRLAGRIVVDATNPLQPDWSPLPTAPHASGAAWLQTLLPGARLVKGFNTVFADIMTPQGLRRERAGGRRVTCFLAADDEAAMAAVAGFAAALGFDPVCCGPLRLAAWLEGMAHLNIALAVGRGGGTDAAFLYDRAGG